MVDLHRHDECSLFDGFGKAKELAALAKKLGHTSFSSTNHGNTTGLVKHYEACDIVGIKCIMGVEAYFQPVKYSEEKRKEKPRFHLCLYAKNLTGYQNMNRLQYEGEKNKYYNPIVTFDMLEKYHEGLICSSACVQGIIAWAIRENKMELAEKSMQKFVDIFGDDFYVEIQPYIIDNDGTQERINVGLMELAKKLGVKCILTSDSHYGSKDDWDTYCKMHEIAKHNIDVDMTYGERYMPTEKQLKNRMLRMHRDDLVKMGYDPKSYIKKMMRNLQEIEDKVEQNILGELHEELPKIHEGADSFDKLVEDVKAGLKKHGKYNKKYIERCKTELKTIKLNGFADYFLIVADYVRWAKERGIAVGPGRGSVCNCQVAWALGITTVDSLRFDLDFRRFLRDDKKKLPDIDLDFETSRRQEVIDYLIDKYKGHAAQVCSYGLYKIDNCINDLAKVCGLYDKGEISRLKNYITKFVDETYHFDYQEDDETFIEFNEQYDNIVKHFSKLYNKMRFIGTHAAGVAITGADIKSYCAIRITKDKATGVQREYTVYDLADLERIKVVKFDMLGLKTMESLGELRRLTGNDETVLEQCYEDQKIYEHFAQGDCDGIFQFETETPRKFLRDCKCDCFDDITAISSMNRPGPLSMKMPEQYCINKFDKEAAERDTPYYEYVRDTYGIIVYQEQLQRVATEVGKLSWADADRLMKLMKQAIATMGDLDTIQEERRDMTERFVKGAMENGWTEDDARTTFAGMMKYLFNKGHSVGYSMISLEEMYYKVYHPMYFWYVKLKYVNSSDDSKRLKFLEDASNAECVIMLPHVNYSADYSLRKVDGEMVIQQGLSSIKGIGEKAAAFIENERRKNGVFTCYDDFYDRCKSRTITTRVINILREHGALEFNKRIYIKRVTKYNSTLYAKSMREGFGRGSESQNMKSRNYRIMQGRNK